MRHLFCLAYNRLRQQGTIRHTLYIEHVAARSMSYAKQPAGSIKTSQQYRKAMGLPLRYDKQSYEWCSDYEQMS